METGDEIATKLSVSVGQLQLVAQDKIPHLCLANCELERGGGAATGGGDSSPQILIELSLVRGTSCAS